jgi:hypothetical protein
MNPSMRHFRPYGRVIVALSILLCGLALLSQIPLLAGAVSWQRFADAYDDIVVVTRAEWRSSDGELRVRATTSAGANAVLSVYETSTGQRIGVMSYQSGDEHRGDFAWHHNPAVITVRSSLGGEATVLVTGDNPPTTTSEVPTATQVTPTATATRATPTATGVEPTATRATPTATAVTPTATSVGWIDWVYLPRNLK